MPIKTPPLINGEIYHIVIRGVDGLKLFRDKQDHLRMIHNLFVFNNENSVSSTIRWRINKSSSKIILDNIPKRRLLVEVFAFCLMSNHLHLLVKQVNNGGISKFMRKIGAGYGLYYNQKYKRSGRIFQGRYRIVYVENDDQLKTVFVYIHTNPVAIIVPHWKERGIKNYKKVAYFIENYRWSSYLDYLGKKNFPSITSREFLINEIGGIKECQRFVNDWLAFKKELADYDRLALE